MKLYEIKVEYHETLHPKLWNGLKLKKEVRKKLLEIADAFIEYIDIPMEVKDIIFIGSMTNYNWTTLSDIDLHIVIDLEKFKKHCKVFTDDFFNDKKTLFNEHHDITIFGIPVEVYAEGENEKNSQKSETVFSVLNDEWIKKPKYSPPDVDVTKAEKKANEWKQEIDRLIKATDDPDDLEDVKTKIQDDRKKGITSGGEFDERNIAFKELRRSGHLERLKNEKRKKESEKLSLK